jgi:DNA invertase Pin-like site-specific DNA recombinase
MKIGYARVSTHDQNLDLQIDALKKYGCDKIYEEKMSGKNNKDRPVLLDCLANIRTGDTLVFWRLDRLGRGMKELLMIVNDLQAKGVSIVSLTESIDTTTPTGSLVFHLFASLAEFERNTITERTKAGLAAARTRGRTGGRPTKLTEKDITMIRQLMTDPKNTADEVAEKFKVSRSTIYKSIKT